MNSRVIEAPEQGSAPVQPRVHQLGRTDALLALHTVARNVETTHREFVLSTQRIMRLLLEEALGDLRHVDASPTTPIGSEFHGRSRVQPEVFAVSVPRAGDALEAELRTIVPDARLGKILIQRHPERKVPVFHWSKLPDGIAGKEVLLLDPMMATAGTVKMATSILVGAGVQPSDIILVNFLTCAEALEKLFVEYPDIRVVTSFIDDGLNDQAFMRPGIGDFGDRYFGSHR